MKSLKIIFAIAFTILASKSFAQSLTCLSPTLILKDASQNGWPLIGTNTINCNFGGLIAVETDPKTNFPTLTQGNSPCIRMQTSLTNTNATTNNSIALFQGTVAQGAVCGTCAVSIPNNSLFTLYWSGLVPSMSHSYVLCNTLIAPNMTYSFYSCYDDNLITSGTWNNGIANNCSTVTIPANTPIGTASFVISPTVVPAAVVLNNGAGYIVYNPALMAPGIYSVTYTFNSQNSCTTSATRTFEIVNPYAGPGSAWTVPSPLCPYNSCVSLNAQLSLGSYTGGSWSGTGVSSSSFCPSISGSGSFAVTYSVGISSVCSATNTNTIVVTQQPTANAGPTKSLTCIANPTILTGGGGGTYSWSGPGGFTSSAQNPTAGISGTYSLTVNNGTCVSPPSTVQIVTNTTPPTLPTNTVSNILTCLNPNAIINTTGSGVTYTWSGPGIVAGSASANPTVNLPGSYGYTVTSTTNGCTSIGSASVSQNNTVSVSLSTVGVITCVNNSVTISGNQPTFSYTWSAPGGGIILSGQSTPTVNVQGAGAYTATVMNPANGCTASAVMSTSVSTVQAAPNAVASGTVNCIGNSFTLSSSTSGVTYTWVAPGGGTVTSPNTASTGANGSGVYTLNVTNTSNGCTNTRTVSPVTQTNSPTASIANNPTVTCTNSFVTINGNPGAGVTYSWSGPGIVGSNTVQNIGANAGGIYSLVVTSNSNGCTSAVTVNIPTNFATSTISALSQTASLICATPTVALSGTAAPAGSTYTWTSVGGGFASGINGQTVAVTTATNYYLVSTHPVSGCTTSLTYSVIPDINAPTFTVSNSSPSITCFGAPSVSVTITSTIPISSYSWSPSIGISGPTNTSTATFTLDGTYTAVITATNGCSSNVVIPVATATDAPAMVAGSGTAQALSCTNSVVLIAPVFSPSANLTFTWSGPGIVGSANNNNVLVNLPGSYSVIVTNSLTGCSTTSIIVPVSGNNTAPSLTVASSSSLGITCSPSSSTVNISASSSGAVSYSWSTGSTNSSITTSVSGIYTVTVTDIVSGCATTETINVQNNTTAPTLTADANGNLPCSLPASTTLNAVSSNTSNTYSWNGPLNGIQSGSNTANPVVSLPGAYTVIVTDAVTGCTTSALVNVSQVTVNALAVPNVTVGDLPLTITFSNASTGATTYSWNLGDGSTTSSSDPSNTYSTSGSYTIILYAMNGSCMSSDTIVIKVNTGLEIPQVFTPNGDNKNDVFFIKGLDVYPKNILKIFNRWGNPVYSAEPYLNDWDGVPNEAGKTGSGKLPSATYYYILDLQDGKTEVFKGYVQIQY
ncbi:MAG: gliding motility-associated C-terminal domain-containing protein [Sphingobacteriaceae bacterium]|nr:gliding motility-associated C-terminal domain-containing protein [Sphingobacteriaceae bacterium]